MDGCGSRFSQFEEAKMGFLYTLFVVHDDGCDEATTQVNLNNLQIFWTTCR